MSRAWWTCTYTCGTRGTPIKRTSAPARLRRPGRVTSLACMANTDPVLDCPEQLHYVRERAKEGSVHVYPIAAVSVG